MADAADAETKGGTISVGYALRDKRIATFITPELLQYGKEKGVDFVKVNPSDALETQGPFDLILHKIDSQEWADNLKSYSLAHPEVVVVDDYDAVHRLDDRRLMLDVVDKLEHGVLKGLGARVEVPRQLTLERDVKPSDIAAIVEKEGFRLPAVAKPIEANGTHGSHSLVLVLNSDALQHVEPPVILQEFMNHGGILFKLYLLGDRVMVFRRHSLPDIQPPNDGASQAPGAGKAAAEGLPEQLEGQVSNDTVEAVVEAAKEKSGLVQLSRISNVHLTEDELRDSRVTDPPPELMRTVGLGLKKLLALHAFNVDILREGGHGDKYYIVDINYMPGYERMPDFPELLVEFVLQRVVGRRESLKAEGDQVEPDRIKQKELNVPVTSPQQPYPVLHGKKKWVYFRAAMKFCGLEHRNRHSSKNLDAPPAE